MVDSSNDPTPKNLHHQRIGESECCESLARTTTQHPNHTDPVALLNTIGKTMDAIIAGRLSYLTDTDQLLPETHMGGSEQRLTEHEPYFIKKIYERP